MQRLRRQIQFSFVSGNRSNLNGKIICISRLDLLRGLIKIKFEWLANQWTLFFSPYLA
jgi:hypothetical protein